MSMLCIEIYDGLLVKGSAYRHSTETGSGMFLRTELVAMWCETAPAAMT